MKYFRFIPALIWMAIIFYFSGQPTTGVTGSYSIPFISIYWQRFFILKFFHLVEYGTLYFLLFFATGSSARSILFGYLYALTDEFHQSFTSGRAARFSDTIIDLVGIVVGYFVLNQIVSKILKK